jgi:hypothetical protein
VVDMLRACDSGVMERMGLLVEKGRKRREKRVEAIGAAKDIGQNNFWDRVGLSWMGSGEEEGKLTRQIQYLHARLRLSGVDNWYGILEDMENLRAKDPERKPKKRQSRSGSYRARIASSKFLTNRSSPHSSDFCNCKALT